MKSRRTRNATASVVLLVLPGLLTCLPGARSEGPFVDDMVVRASRMAYYQGADGRATVKMAITDARGQVREREMTILRRDVVPAGTEGDEHCGEQRLYVYFHRPADVAKMAFMVWKHPDKDDGCRLEPALKGLAPPYQAGSDEIRWFLGPMRCPAHRIGPESVEGRRKSRHPAGRAGGRASHASASQTKAVAGIGVATPRQDLRALRPRRGRDALQDRLRLYLPALDLVKRIAATDERTSFVGSDFFYSANATPGAHRESTCASGVRRRGRSVPSRGGRRIFCTLGISMGTDDWLVPNSQFRFLAGQCLSYVASPSRRTAFRNRAKSTKSMPCVAEGRCAGCRICTRDCPADAIVMENQVARIDDEKCIRCGKCRDICPTEAVRHDGGRVPLLLETNRQYVLRLPGHCNTADERQALLTKLIRHFGIRSRVGVETIDWINANTEKLSAEGAIG